METVVLSYLAVRNVMLSAPPSGEFMCEHAQWRIQDFPEGGANSKSDDVIPLLRQISRNFMKIEFWTNIGKIISGKKLPPVGIEPGTSGILLWWLADWADLSLLVGLKL